MRETWRWPMALRTYVGWTPVTLFGMRWASDGSKKPLVETVTHSIAWILAMAVGLLAVVTLAMRWRDLKFVAPRPARSLRVLWFPAPYLLFFALLPAVLGLPSAGALLFIGLNTLLVGQSEEWVFRGVRFQGLRSWRRCGRRSCSRRCCSVRYTCSTSSPPASWPRRWCRPWRPS